MEELTKICNCCGEEKSILDFPIHSATKDGRRGDCKLCYNERVRSTRSRKIANKKPQKEPSKLELLEKDFLKIKATIGTKEFNQDNIFEFSSKLAEVHKELRYPPTNSFIVRQYDFPDAIQKESYENQANYIKSYLSLFLVSKLSKIHEDFSIVKSKKYQRDHSIQVILNTNLTRENIEDFILSLRNSKKNNTMHHCEIKLENIDLRQYVSLLLLETKKNLYRIGYDIDISNMTVRFIKDDHIMIEWPKKNSIDEDEVNKLNGYIMSYIVNNI
jgi:hypothetical protein